MAIKFIDYSNKNYNAFPKVLKGEIDVQELYLRHNYLKQIPHWISKLINLTDLSIYDNCLSDLPEEIGLLANLRSLDVGRNYLRALPKNIVNLKNLNFLAVENNYLTEIPEEIGYLKHLIVLQLSNNKIAKIPLTIVFCKSLYAIHLENNNLLSIPNNLVFLPSIEFLTICNNKLLYLPSLSFTKKVHLDMTHNSYVNYVSYNFYEKKIQCNACDRWFCHKNHENVMLFRKNIEVFDFNRLKNITLEITVANKIRRIIMNEMYCNVYHTEDGYFPTLFELALRTTFETISLKELCNIYCQEKYEIPTITNYLIKTLIKGPVAKCQQCNNFIFTESVIWIVPKIVHCVICIKMEVPVVTVVNFCSSRCATTFSLLESLTEENAKLSNFKVPWKRLK